MTPLASLSPDVQILHHQIPQIHRPLAEIINNWLVFVSFCTVEDITVIYVVAHRLALSMCRYGSRE